jgi:hypothetical protein
MLRKEDAHDAVPTPCLQSGPNPSTNTQEAHLQEAAARATAARLADIQQQAHCLRERTAAGYLYASNAGIFQGTLEVAGYDQYVTDLVQEAGAPSDPIERMLVEQLALAHHNLGRLHVEAAASKGTAEAALLNAAVARLLSEFRKTALALKSYRTPCVSSTATAKLVLKEAKSPAFGE